MNRTNAVGRAVKSAYFIGLDLGQEDQRSAIAVVERAEVESDQAYWAQRREVELRYGT